MALTQATHKAYYHGMSLSISINSSPEKRFFHFGAVNARAGEIDSRDPSALI